MERGSFRGFSRDDHAQGHRFPRGTLLVSVCLLVGGLRLADVLPTPSLPRLPAAPVTPVAEAAVLSDNGSRLSPLPAAPGGVLPAAPITAADVRFQPIQVPMGPLTARIRAVADKGRVVLSDVRKGTVLWSGRVADARFLYSEIAPHRALKDSRGKVLWSETPVPDLSLSRSDDGTARLRDRQGRTLWEGALNPSPQKVSLPAHSERRRTTRSVDFAGIKVRGINGFFSLMDDTSRETRVLWSGTVPGDGPPTLLLRDRHRFFFWGDGGPVAGSDRMMTIEMREEVGQVTITDPQIRVVDRQTVPLLTVTSALHLVGEERIIPVPCQYYVPFARLTKAGCAQFTYRNTRGNVVLSNSVVRDGQRQRINTNYGPPL